MINIKDYRKEISLAKPQSGGCKYLYENWVAHFPNKNILTCVSEYKERKISRSTVINAFRNYFTEPKMGFDKPLLLTMIWGFNNVGYGPHRANDYLTGANNKRLIRESLNAVDAGDIDGAFKKLSGIDRLGMSYISKILYFACKAKVMVKYPLIFDIRVARAIVSLSTNGKFDKILDIKPAKTLRAYKDYNDPLHSWAKELKVDADKIEYFLFSHRN